jgi:hypothetical protein
VRCIVRYNVQYTSPRLRAYVGHDLHLILKLTLGVSSTHFVVYVGHDHCTLKLVFHVTSTHVKSDVGHDHRTLKTCVPRDLHVCLKLMLDMTTAP